MNATSANDMSSRGEKDPVFVVGCGHSGTSLLLAILGSHPGIHAVPGESGIALKGNQDLFRASEGRFDREAVAAGKRRWAEKTPKHIRHIGRILEWDSNARIVLIVRDGRDVAWSIKQRTGSIELGIDRWVNDNMAGKPYWGHPRVYRVKYEEIIEHFDSTISGVMGFLNEEYRPEMRHYHKTEKLWYSDSILRPENAFGSNHGLYRNWQINQPLFDGRGRWKELTQEEICFVENVGGQMLDALGYERSVRT